MAKRDKTTRLLGSMKEKRTPIAPGMFLPDTSGDHVRSIKRAAPVDNKDLVNKEYVDNKFPVTHASTTGQGQDDHHARGHSISSHNDTTATGAELNTLTDNSVANTLHRHSELVASDGAPDPALSVDATGQVGIGITPISLLHLQGNNQIVKFYPDFTASTAITRTMSGVEIGNVGNADAVTNKYLPAIKFMSADSSFTTENPKFLGGILPRPADNYTNDSAGGLNIDFAVAPIAPGTTSVPIVKMTLASTGNLGIGTTTPTQPLSIKEKSCMTAIGGFAIKLTNKTGANSVQGETVKTDAANDDSVVLCATADDDIIGVFLETGTADGAEAWIVVNGIADVLADNIGFTRGDRLVTSLTAVTVARATANNAPAVAVHFQEIGHAIETAARNTLGRVVLHFN